VLLVAVHACDGAVPAAQALQFLHGARPVAFQLTPGTHELRVHVAFVAFHA